MSTQPQRVHTQPSAAAADAQPWDDAVRRRKPTPSSAERLIRGGRTARRTRRDVFPVDAAPTLSGVRFVAPLWGGSDGTPSDRDLTVRSTAFLGCVEQR